MNEYITPFDRTSIRCSLLDVLSGFPTEQQQLILIQVLNDTSRATGLSDEPFEKLNTLMEEESLKRQDGLSPSENLDKS